MQTPRQEAVRSAIERINRAWLAGNVEALVPIVDPDIIMVFPGFAGRSQGREQFLAGNWPNYCSTTEPDFRECQYRRS